MPQSDTKKVIAHVAHEYIKALLAAHFFTSRLPSRHAVPLRFRRKSTEWEVMRWVGGNGPPFQGGSGKRKNFA